jgi:hypothetical protein
MVRRGECHHGGSRLAVRSSCLYHSRIGNTQPTQGRPRLRQLGLRAGTLNCQHSPAWPEKADGQASQLVQRRNRPRRHYVRRHLAREVLGASPNHVSIGQAKGGDGLLEEVNAARQRLKQCHPRARQEYGKHDAWQPTTRAHVHQ